MYRIKWVSKFTGAEGYGKGLFTLEQAEQIATGLNNEEGAVCNHFPVPAAETKPADESLDKEVIIEYD